MAEVTAFRNNALPYPIYGAPFTVVYPMLDADGDLVSGAATPDAEVSKNGDTFTDCTSESTEIATASGFYYLTLTSAELTCDVAAIIAKSVTAGMKTTALTLYPRKLVTVRAGTSASLGTLTNAIVLDAGASAVDGFYKGMVCVATIDGAVEARLISDYVGSSKTASVVPDWNVAPDNSDTFVIKLPEGVMINQSYAVGGALDTVAGVGADGITAASLAADVGTELAAALGGRAVTAFTSIPAATASFEVVLGYLLAEFRNLKQLNRTTGVETLYRDDGTTVSGTRTNSDDGTTFTRPEQV